MTSLIDAIVRDGAEPDRDPDFPHAPEDWAPGDAIDAARQEGLELGNDHWQALRCLQEYFARHKEDTINLRELHDALDERFHRIGGLKLLYQLFPGGPVAQGCRLAGLNAPAGALDRGFGSVA